MIIQPLETFEARLQRFKKLYEAHLFRCSTVIHRLVSDQKHSFQQVKRSTYQSITSEKSHYWPMIMNRKRRFLYFLIPFRNRKPCSLPHQSLHRPKKIDHWHLYLQTLLAPNLVCRSCRRGYCPHGTVDEMGWVLVAVSGFDLSFFILIPLQSFWTALILHYTKFFIGPYVSVITTTLSSISTEWIAFKLTIFSYWNRLQTFENWFPFLNCRHYIDFERSLLEELHCNQPKSDFD